MSQDLDETVPDQTTLDQTAPAGEACCGGVTEWVRGDDADELAGALSAVADSTRVQILSIIGRAEAGEVCACDFVGPIGKSQPTISHHLKILTEAGLIEGDKRGRWIWYRLAAGSLESLATRIGSLGAPVGTDAVH